jgi:hypothetical protein
MLILSSCGDATTPDINTNSTMTATVNGNEWTANSTFYNKLFAQLMGTENVNASGTNTNLISIQFNISEVLPSVGTHNVTALYKEVRDGNFINWEDMNGVCVITSADDDYIKGTFNLKADDAAGIEDQKVITGEFNSEVK